MEAPMSRTSLCAALLVLLACGGAPPPEPTVAAGPTACVPGPGTATAADGAPVAYTLAGEGSPALVFIHGWMCDQSFWAAQVPAFAATHTVVTVDLPGHGASGMVREGWPLMAFGSDVRAVIEQLGLERVILVGHSMGGPVALEAARLMPERVVGIVAVDSLHNAELKYDPQQMAGLLAAFEQDFVATCGQFSTSMFVPGASPALVEQVTTAMCDGSPEIATALFRQFIDYDMGKALAAVTVPVRCINAAGYPTAIEINRKYHPDFDGVTMDGVGHFLMIERPEEFNGELAKSIAEIGGAATGRVDEAQF
jgi:pimeloyl-ACP methyl ester carboxylesterase